jgi:hypothetical protein
MRLAVTVVEPIGRWLITSLLDHELDARIRLVLRADIEPVSPSGARTITAVLLGCGPSAEHGAAQGGTICAADDRLDGPGFESGCCRSSRASG